MVLGETRNMFSIRECLIFVYGQLYFIADTET
jgi:hypothetical protein